MSQFFNSRCLLVAQTFPPQLGGSGEVHAALARHAPKDGGAGAIAVLTGWRDHRTGQEQPGWRAHDAAAPYPIRRLPLVRPALRQAAPPHSWPRGALARRASWGWGALRLAAAVAAEARRHRATAVCVCDDETVGGWLLPFVRRILGLRALVLCHGDDLVPEGAAARARRLAVLRRADLCVGAGRVAAERLAALGVEPSRIGRVPNGVDLARFRPLAEPEGLRARLGLAGRRVILAPTRLVPRKGVDRLLEALPVILAAEPRAALLVAGEGPQRAALEGAARGLPVVFAGAVAADAMPGLYALAELVALPNREEPGESDGMPLVFLEAGACGRPVLGGRAAGTPEAVEEGVNGLLVDGTDPGDIAAAALRVLADPALAARLAAGGRAAAARNGWEGRARDFLALCGG